MKSRHRFFLFSPIVIRLGEQTKKLSKRARDTKAAERQLERLFFIAVINENEADFCPTLLERKEAFVRSIDRRLETPHLSRSTKKLPFMSAIFNDDETTLSRARTQTSAIFFADRFLSLSSMHHHHRPKRRHVRTYVRRKHARERKMSKGGGNDDNNAEKTPSKTNKAIVCSQKRHRLY